MGTQLMRMRMQLRNCNMSSHLRMNAALRICMHAA